MKGQYRYHYHLGVHYTLRGGFGAIKVNLDIVEDSKACCGFESGEEEGDIFEASKKDLN